VATVFNHIMPDLFKRRPDLKNSPALKDLSDLEKEAAIENARRGVTTRDGTDKWLDAKIRPHEKRD